MWGLFQLRWAVRAEVNSIYFVWFWRLFPIANSFVASCSRERMPYNVCRNNLLLLLNCLLLSVAMFLTDKSFHFGHILQISLQSFHFSHFAAVHEEKKVRALTMGVIVKCDTLYLFIWVVCLTRLKDNDWKNKYQHPSVISGLRKRRKSYIIWKYLTAEFWASCKNFNRSVSHQKIHSIQPENDSWNHRKKKMF